MTKTALENKKLESNENIANNRNAAELKKAKEIEEMREKHERKENMKDRITQGIFGLLPKSSFSLRTNFNPKKKDDLAFKNPGYWNNHPEWYRRYPVDISAWAAINTYNRVGQAVFGGRFYTWGSKMWAIPGVMIMHWLPTVGPKETNKEMAACAPINLTLARSRQKVLELNSRSNVDWQAGDLGYNLIATASITVAIEELRRVIKVYNTWSSKNAYLARHLVTSLGFDYDDLVANKSFVKEQLVSLIAAFNVSIVAPRAASYYDRQMFLASNIFADSLSEWAQFYAYVCDGFFKLSNDATSVQLTELDRTDVHSYTQAIWNMINAITTDDSFSEMYNDLRHAFREDIVQLTDFKLGDSETMVFNADKTNRMQIHNIKTLPGVDFEGNSVEINLNEWSVHQDSNGWLYQGNSSASDHARVVRMKLANDTAVTPAVNIIKYFYMDNTGAQLFDTGDYVPNEDGFLEITRAVPIMDSVVGSASNKDITLKVKSCGTELVTKCTIWALNSSDSEVKNFDFHTLSLNSIPNAFAGESPLYIASLVSTFNWHPIIHFARGYSSTSAHPDGIFTVSELEYAFVGNNESIAHLHDLCVQSEFYLAPSQFKA